MPRRRRPRRRRTAGRRPSIFDLDFPQTKEAREVEGLRNDVQRLFRSQQPQIETEGLDTVTQPKIETKPTELPHIEMEGFDTITLPKIEAKSVELPQMETEGLTAIARLLEPVRSADELADLKMALNDALRLGKQTVTTPRKPSSRPPEFVGEEEEELM